MEVGLASQVAAQFQWQSVGCQLLVGQGQPTPVLTGEIAAFLGAEQFDDGDAFGLRNGDGVVHVGTDGTGTTSEEDG